MKTSLRLVVALVLLALPPSAFSAASRAHTAQGALGIVVSKAPEGGSTVIMRVLDGSPAQAAGLLADDQVLAIDDLSTETLSLDEAVSRLRGPVGTWVKLGILSGEDRFDLDLQRAAPQP